MFVRRPEPVLLSEQSIEGLCPSLNRPVVDADGVPVGPARAVIALYRLPEGGRGLTVALRSEDSGVVTTFEFQGELSSAAHLALDTGLCFAEGMGFLFDDDMLTSGDGGGRRRALECWCALTGDELPASLPGPAADLLDDPDDLGLLDEVLPSPALSRFRVGGDPAPSVPEPAGRPPGEESAPAQLGRIPILRRRNPDVPAPPVLLTRLLARF